MLEDSTIWSHQASHELLNNDIPLQPVALNGDYAALQARGVSMMASDWIDPEAVPRAHPAASVDPAEYARMEERLARLVPAWADPASSAADGNARRRNVIEEEDPPIR